MSRAITWLRRRPFETWVTLALVGGSVGFIWLALYPHLLLADTTPNGGDLGAHVWGPAYLRDHLLPQWRLSGWAPDWYAGFPAYQFYMVVPSLFVVLLDALGLSYNVAFKLVTVSGLLALPICAWGMARLARQRFPVPVACAVATLAFVFDRSFSIYGGNALSTLAGEFSFTISLCFALLFLGAVARGVETRRGKALAAVLLALCVTCHVIPALFSFVGAGAITLVTWWSRRPQEAEPYWVGFDPAPAGEPATPARAPYEPWRSTEVNAVADGSATEAEEPIDTRRTLGSMAVVVVVGGLLSAFWAVPFVLRRAYMTDMGWQKKTEYLEMLFPGRIGRSLTSFVGSVYGDGGGHHGQVPGDSTWLICFAVIGGVAAVAFHRRFSTSLVLTAVVLAVAIRFAPQGRLWNARLLPFWYLCLYLLAAVAVAEVLVAAAALVRPDEEGERVRRLTVAGASVVGAVVLLVAVAFPLRMLPFATTSPDGRSYSWFVRTSTDQSLVRSWAKWDFTGYERKPAYHEYQALIDTMKGVGQTDGCGRAMWEYDSSLDRFGTPMALMLLPYWTDQCIGSMEGLYFEASATTPYHFLNQAELSAAPSRAQRDLDYGPLDVHEGVAHLQMLGVRYYIAFSAAAVKQADAEPALSHIATSGLFRIYEVADSQLVEGLANQPAVIKGAPTGGAAWQELAESWYLDDARHAVYLAADGPASWARVAASALPDAAKDAKALPAVKVSDIESDDHTISFTVDRTGVPVVVKTSYFPNWKAEGADGPYRVAPNLMVVVPTSTHVRLVYGRTSVDWLGTGLTGVGFLSLAAIGLVGRRGRRRGGGSAPTTGIATRLQSPTVDPTPSRSTVGAAPVTIPPIGPPPLPPTSPRGTER